MANLSHDRIGLIGRALSETTWVHMHVGDDFAPGLAAVSPEIAEPPPVDFDDCRYRARGSMSS